MKPDAAETESLFDFETLYRAYAERVRQFMYGEFRNFTLAEDLTQDVFTRIYAAQKRGHVIRQYPRGYVWQVAKSVIIDHRRNRDALNYSVMSIDVQGYRTGGLQQDGDEVRASKEEVMFAGESNMEERCVQRMEIGRAARRLTAAQRDAVACFVHGYKAEDAGRALGVSAATYKARLYRGMVAMGEQLQSEWVQH